MIDVMKLDQKIESTQVWLMSVVGDLDSLDSFIRPQ